ncbi:Gustatory receptor [Caenorhabditis elegans]|uniref:Gustatory receptor n=2 Tax=Caenorhabditis elegans TaxID=6239 RepID=Q6EZH2_CAEEL|nr:Gustatory receptor [Caenorhabditis elegans]CCD67322.1 Gustatory receptor [Caenorhabditis elegans]|eukprot:NP_001021068.1 Uncharacterized protein CELE_D1007.10 [Caenorhabditis elegans]
MRTLRIAQYSVLTVGFAIYMYRLIEEIPIDIRNLNSDSLEGIINSDELCDVTVSNRNRGLLVRNDSLDLDILKAKFTTFFSKRYLTRFLSEQVPFLHVIDEALLVKRFVMCACFMVFCLTVIWFLVIRRMGNLIKRLSVLNQLEDAESVEWARCIREFTQEKLAVLCFCIVPPFAQTDNKHYIDFGEYVRDTFALRSRCTDLTLFACWYCFIAICHVATNTIFSRYVKTIHLVQRPLKTRIRGQAVFLVQFFTMNSIAALAAILFGAAGLSFMFIHFNYAAILFLESYRVFVRSLFVLGRLSVSTSTARMNDIEEQKHLSDEEITDLIVNSQKRIGKYLNFRNIYITSTVFVTFLLNILYAITGLLINRKMLAFGFAIGANQVIDDILNGREYGSTELL